MPYPKTKEIRRARRTAAEEIQAGRKTRTDKQQLELIETRRLAGRGESRKEYARISARMQKNTEKLVESVDKPITELDRMRAKERREEERKKRQSA